MKSRFVKANAKPRGFTLVEVLMAAMLIGLAITALVASSGAFTLYNAMGVDLSTAEFLIEEIRELTAPVLFADLGPYNGQTYSPPRDANGDNLSDFSAYRQVITVGYVNPANLTQTSVTATDLRRVTVTITKAGRTITSASWIRAKY
ncbi:MAG: type II secretion system protein [Planctomycetes bacterium]|nr:type II secretion system protein [Planctomycetota bacterium]